MKVSDMFPRKYATGGDLDGKAVTLTIARLAAEEMRPKRNAPPEQKYVLYFEKAKKGLVLNRTNTYKIRDLHGEDTDDWTGKRITLYPVPMTVARQPRVAIRIRAPAPENGHGAPPAGLVEEEKPVVDPDTGEILSA